MKLNLLYIYIIFFATILFLSLPAQANAQTCDSLGKQDCGGICPGRTDIRWCCNQSPACNSGCIATANCTGTRQDCRTAPNNYCNSAAICSGAQCCDNTCDQDTGACISNTFTCSDFSSQIAAKAASTPCGQSFTWSASRSDCPGGSGLSCPGIGTANCGPVCRCVSSNQAATACGQPSTDSCGVPNSSCPGTKCGGTCMCNPANYACGTDLNNVPGCDPNGSKSCPAGLACSPGQTCPGTIGSTCTSGGGGDVCSPILDVGAGCGPGQPGCCDTSSGLMCRNGTCQKLSVAGPCKLPRSELLWPVSTDPVTPVVVPYNTFLSSSNPSSPNSGRPLNWRSNLDPRASCTDARDGLWANLYIDGQLIQQIHAPGYGYNGSENNAYNSFPNPSAWSNNDNASFTYAVAGVTQPPLSDKQQGAFYLPYTPTPGVIHTWWVEYVSPNGNLGGSAQANNWTLGRFIIGGAPNVPKKPSAPKPTCLQNNPSDPYGSNDICDSSMTPPASFGSNTHFTITAQDQGPKSGVNYFHLMTIDDLTVSGRRWSLTPSPNPTTINGLFNFNLKAISGLLQDGHAYRWTANSSDPTVVDPSFMTSDPSVPWDFLYDITPPIGSINGLTNGVCYDRTTLPASFGVVASDPIPGGSPNRASGLKQTLLTINGTPRDVSTFCSGGSGNWTCPTSFVTKPGDIYNLTVNTVDNAGNNGYTSTTRFIYKTQCIGPWLQTTGGDVHSNDKVSTPGGPQ